MLRSTLRSSRVTIASLFLLSTGAAALACSGDDSAGAPPPPADSGAPGDASHDGSTSPDASSSPDGSSNDAGAGDSSASDASLDTSSPQDSSSQDAPTDSGDSSTVDGGISLASWMTGIPGATSLAAISIPGTHDTGATIDVPGTTGTTKTQNLSVGDQLAIGVRYMDIRLKAMTNASFEVFHTTVDQNLSFDQVLQSASSFLTANPGETVVMCVKQEQGAAAGVTSTFEQVFESYTTRNATLWYLGATIPTLDQARGKIVLLRRFGAATLPKGIDASSGWADNVTFTLANGSATLRIQDYYQVTDDPSKWAAITGLFTEATAAGTQTDAGDAGVTLYLNNTSAYFQLDSGLEDIPDVSNVINPELVTYFTSNTSGRFGIVGMDFVDATKASLILSTNFH